jgi:hypothetical protein
VSGILKHPEKNIAKPSQILICKKLNIEKWLLPVPIIGPGANASIIHAMPVQFTLFFFYASGAFLLPCQSPISGYTCVMLNHRASVYGLIDID